jgi:hypothetical protein
VEAPFEQALIGNELRSRIVAFGGSGSLSARLNERRSSDPKIILDLDTQTLDLTEAGLGAESA